MLVKQRTCMPSNGWNKKNKETRVFGIHVICFALYSVHEAKTIKPHLRQTSLLSLNCLICYSIGSFYFKYFISYSRYLLHGTNDSAIGTHYSMSFSFAVVSTSSMLQKEINLNNTGERYSSAVQPSSSFQLHSSKIFVWDLMDLDLDQSFLNGRKATRKDTFLLFRSIIIFNSKVKSRVCFKSMMFYFFRGNLQTKWKWG